MVKLLVELLSFLRSCAPLLTSLVILTLLCILLAKSIKKYAVVYYIILGIPFVLIALPVIAGLLGVEKISFVRIPFLGEIIRDYIHMGTFGHPLLIIIMYMGALDPKVPNVGKLLSIRKELSIISGFAVFAHSLIRVINNLPNSLKFFTDNAGYMSNTKAASELGAGISSFSFVLGVFMLILFIPLWVTSFGAVRRQMGNVKWKKFQRWSYVLYATLFIHAMGIQIGGMLNPRGGHAPTTTTVETKIVQENVTAGQSEQTARIAGSENRGGNNKISEPAEGSREANGDVVQRTEGSRQNGNNEVAKQTESNNRQGEQIARPASGGHMPGKGFADIKVSAQAKRYIHLISLILIYGSYLYLRLRKAKKDAEKRTKIAKVNN
jgi:DMSO/TMAO reductase YedYZ heme-binding membrane subunit